jgi:outer membrane receptor protein involved in Fe transport
MEIKKISFLFCFLFAITVVSQNNKKNTGTITGIILDSQSNKKLAYATIICKDKKHTILTGNITSSKGEFKITQLPLDSIFINIQFIGYKSFEKKIFLSAKKPNLNLYKIYLQEVTVNLDEVVIDAEVSFMEQKIDRKVYNVGKDLNAAGTNSFELLENIPSIQVDFQNGAINLRGNSNVRVLVDGKPSNLSSSQLLKQIPASSVKSVEIITNPSAKYNPEGMSGIINIILKKNSSIGFNGSVTLGVEKGINTRPSGSFDFNYRVNKFNFYGNYGLDFGKFETNSFLNRLDKNLNQNLDFLDNSTTNFAKIGVDFYINPKNTLSFYINKSYTNTDFFVDTKTFLDTNLIFDAENLSIFKNRETAYNLDYKLDFKKEGGYIEFEINYTKTDNPQEDTITENLNKNNREFNFSNSTESDNSIFLANLDYAKPIKNGVLELGLEAKVQNVFNSIITTQEIQTGGGQPSFPQGNSDLTYDREIYSGYVNLSKEYKKISWQAGFRFEQFILNGTFSNTQQTNLDDIKNNIFSVYPSTYLTFTPSEKNQFQIGYSRRVDRPSIGQVTPIQEWNSPLSISIGNRNLVPQFTNSFEINYSRSLEKGSINLVAFYRKTSDLIGRVFNIDATNEDRQIITYANFDSAESYGFEFSSRFKPFSWWTLSPSANFYFQDNQGFINNNLEVANNTLFTARISNSFKATSKLRFSLSASYRGENETVLAKINDYFLVNVAARYSILKGDGSITLRGTDIFDGYKINFLSTNPFQQIGQYTLEYSSVYLGFTYNFGKGKNRERARKYREENETQGSGGVL